MAYTCASDVRLLCGLGDDEIGDGYLESLIEKATARVNMDISTLVTLEEVSYIDEYRDNDIDGSNKTFYVSSSYTYALGDLNDDGELTTADVEAWLYDPSSDTRSAATVSSVSSEGKFVLSSAPDADNILKVTYRYLPLAISPSVHPLIRDATAYLTGAYAHMRINPTDFASVTVGRMKYVKATPGGSYGGFVGTSARLYAEYEKLVSKIDYISNSIISRGLTYLTIDFEDIDKI